jgi:hypothetical protein
MAGTPSPARETRALPNPRPRSASGLAHARASVLARFLRFPPLGSPCMQNQMNLMSSFEFISILISIIIGLGVTNLLAGTGRAFYRRRENPIDETHIVFTAATLLILVLQWWVTFKWNDEVNWSFDKFLVLIVWTISLYMLTTFLFHPICRKRRNTAIVFNGTGPVITPRLLRCVCSISGKRTFAEISFILFGTFRSLDNTRSWPELASLLGAAATTASSRGIN